MLCDVIAAVSYTHLDVYKRQVDNVSVIVDPGRVTTLEATGAAHLYCAAALLVPGSFTSTVRLTALP